VAILLGAVIIIGAGGANAQNQVSGTFTVKGVVTRFAYAYSYWKSSPFGDELMVLLSDVAIPPDTIPKNDDGVAKMAGLVRDGKVHALELHLSPKEKQLDQGENAAVFHGGLSPARSGMSGMHVFVAKTFTDTLIDATARTDGPQVASGVKWQYEAAFKVALPPPDKGR
jgi:hypothetical protein